MPAENRIRRPGSTLHGGGAANIPADRETRFAAYDAEREKKEKT